MTTTSRLVCAGLAVLLPAIAMAQDVSVEFRLAAQPGNIQGCIAADPQFTRVHTFTIKGGQADLKSAGGINTRMKPTRPNVYEADDELGGRVLHIVADLGATPKSLTVTEKNLGCKWTAVRP